MRLSSNNIRSLPQVIYFVPGVVLAVLSFVLRLKALQQTTFANGWDAYFYLVQLKSWIEEGSMHSPDSSFVYSLMRLSYWFSGDYVASFKLLAALLAGLVTFGSFHLARKWSGSLYIGLLIGAISLYSPHLTYFVAQYPKNLLGFVLLLGFLSSLDNKNKAIPLLWLVVCFFGHRLTFGIALLFGLIWTISNHFSIKKVGALFLIGLVLFALSLLIPGLLNITDLERFDGLLSMSPQFAPWSFIQTFGTENRISTWWLGEIMICSVLYFVSIPFLWKAEKRSLVLALFGVASILLFPFFEWNLTGMAYRFFLVYVLMAPLFIALLLKAEHNQMHKISLTLIAVLLMLSSVFSWQSYQPEKHDADYQKYGTLTNRTMMYLNKSNAELIIAHNALAEYFTFTTGIDAMPWNPEYVIDSTKLWRIATDIREIEMAYYLTPGDMEQVYKISIRYFLLPDHLWQKILIKAKAENDTFLIEKLNTWRNPHRIRPGFLLKKKE